MTIFNLPRDERTPETEIDVILTNLGVIYLELNPGVEKYAFVNEVFRELYDNEQTNGDVLSEFLEALAPTNHDGIFKTSRMAELHIACAYCCQAQRAWDAGQIDRAWTFVVDARTRCSLLMSLHPAIDRLKYAEHAEYISRVRRENRLKGVDKYNYEDFVMREYRSRPWKNKTEAVNEINVLLGKHVEEHNVPVKEWKDVGSRGEIIKNKQTDFTRYITNILPSAEQVKRDRDSWVKPL